MKKIILFGVLLLSLFLVVSSCKDKVKTEKSSELIKQGVLEVPDSAVLINTVLSADEQARLTPDAVLEILQKGNKEFTEDNLTVRNNLQRVREAALSQYPKAAIVSCLDSRVPVEDVFHRGIGDIFVARVAGNIINEDILGSLEFACKVSGAKLIVVLGHEHCGAVKSAIDDVKLGNITAMLSKIRPAVAAAAKNYDGDKTSDNPKFVEAVCSQNVDHAINEIRSKSSILKEMEDKGEIKIVGGVYHMETGKVDFL
ncbi:carbonic anhydrase family protein [Dysgonomonas sp. Marseille-P4677]|uniref:carbonic anhydrase family protein n=1 Tax=Dysgonomonas sp. Marseille-P4677 TaxID=2364790 RepID=UPI001EEE409D|nr:carbonic anhydrase family protein [Dysgonomonas sp. Marseille-P4677]